MSNKYESKSAVDPKLIEHLDRLANNMDVAFRIPGTSIRVGWDAIIGLLPGVGDVSTLLPGLYILYHGHRLGVSNWTKARMVANLGIDTVVGSVPVFGDLFDIGFKSHRKNVDLIKSDLAKNTDVV